MDKIKLKYLIINNFRNVKYDSDIKENSDISKLLEKKYKGLYKFGDENLLVFDGENGFGKTTFFTALEFLFLGDKTELENKAISNNLKRERSGDIYRNSKDEDKNKYFVRAIFQKGDDEIDIVRIVSKDQNISKSKVYYVSNLNNEINLEEVFSIHFETYYKNFLYLPQDNVLEFLLDGKRGDGISKLLNVDKEKELKKKITNIRNNIHLLTKKDGIFDKEIKSLENRNTELEEKIKNNSDIKLMNLEEYKDFSIFDKNYSINNLDEENSSYEYKISNITNFIKDYELIEYIKNNYQSYKYKYYFDKINEFKKAEELVNGENFKTFIYCFNNRYKEDYEYKDIDKDIKNKKENLNKLENLQNELKRLSDKDNGRSINQIEDLHLNKYSKDKFENLIDIESFTNFLTKVKNDIERQKSDNKKYDWLKKNVEYLFGNIEKEKFKDIVVYKDENLEKKEKYCPACGSEFLDYDDLKKSVKKQLDYFEEKAKDTKIINLEINKYFDSKDFKNFQENVESKLKYVNKKLDELEKINGLLKDFVSYYKNEELELFIKTLSSDNKNNFTEDYEKYLKKLNNELPKIEIEKVHLDKVKNQLEKEYFELFNNSLEFSKLEKFNKSIPNIDVLNINLEILKKYKDQLEIRKNINDSENIKKENELKIQYLNKRKKVLEKYLNYFKEIEKKLVESINKYESDLTQQIKLPFFIFSKRILKNYQDDSLLLKYNEGQKKVEIKSKKYGNNPIFNFSQGQSITVMLSVLLSLNISISNKNLGFILIDDPIQTLDDLNQLGFINLLRYQFDNKQIIISTHEQEFSNLIRYKFWRLGLTQSSINVKEKFLK